MSRDTVSISLVSSECVHAIGDEKHVAEMLRKAFKDAKHHWMVLEEDPQLKGALNAVLTKLGEDHPDYKRLSTEIEILAKFNAWMRAAQMGVAGDPPSLPDGFEAIGVMKLWHEAA